MPDQVTGPRFVSQLGYVILSVSDVDRWVGLLTEVFGFGVGRLCDDGVVVLRMDAHELRVVLQPGDADDLVSVGWHVHGPTELRDLESRVQASGVACSRATVDETRQRMVQGLVRFTDPGGLLTELSYGPFVSSEPFVPGRPMGGFVAGPLGLGHVVVDVPDQGACEAFYRDVLGFRLSDYGSASLTFMRCNPRHHSIAFAPQRPGAKRLRHVMFEMRDLDDVGRAFDRCLARQDPLATLIGRHVNDLTVSFYVESPSGFEIECSYGGRLVEDEATWEVHRYVDREVWGHQRMDALRKEPQGKDVTVS